MTERNMVFDTPCGFQITLKRTPEGTLGIDAHMSGMRVSFVNSEYVLSKEGAMMLADRIVEIYDQ